MTDELPDCQINWWLLWCLFRQNSIFFKNSVIANLQEPNWVGQTLYLFLQVSNITTNMIL